MKVGDTFADTDFVFTCAQSEEGVMSYEAIACVDAHGKRMQLGEMRKLSNGTVILHCNIYGGAVKKVVERGTSLHPFWSIEVSEESTISHGNKFYSGWLLLQRNYIWRR
ncbi:hypothetical protein ANCDUO_24041 [Ancylostoma duodenale]|uniref:Abnormal cell migration protein 18-like fibronectin type I domain-containing protein n=1 Tax=Ancylostoma duodenale TaxID=51022 RepID=A0A0C2FGT0_9BILA|nr:hypothetical protein ANCDUO_24041 [Ancylostoma duodenale]